LVNERLPLLTPLTQARVSSLRILVSRLVSTVLLPLGTVGTVGTAGYLKEDGIAILYQSSLLNALICPYCLFATTRSTPPPHSPPFFFFFFFFFYLQAGFLDNSAGLGFLPLTPGASFQLILLFHFRLLLFHVISGHGSLYTKPPNFASRACHASYTPTRILNHAILRHVPQLIFQPVASLFSLSSVRVRLCAGLSIDFLYSSSYNLSPTFVHPLFFDSSMRIE
jgi:hypothetical protein